MTHLVLHHQYQALPCSQVHVQVGQPLQLPADRVNSSNPMCVTLPSTTVKLCSCVSSANTCLIVCSLAELTDRDVKLRNCANDVVSCIMWPSGTFVRSNCRSSGQQLTSRATSTELQRCGTAPRCKLPSNTSTCSAASGLAGSKM